MKSYVGMTNCYYCGEASGIVMDNKLRDVFTPNVGVIDMSPCSKCKEYMEKGIILIGIKPPADGEKIEVVNGIPNPYRTGEFLVVTQEGIERMLSGELLEFADKNRFMFMDGELMKEYINRNGEING